MTLTELLSLLWRRSLLILGMLVVALGVGAAIAFTTPVSYQSQTQLLFSQSSTLAPGSEALATQEKLNLMVATYAQIVSSSSFVAQAISAQGLRSTPSVTVSATNPIYASVVDITVASSSPVRTVAVASALDDFTIKAVARSQTGLPSGERITVAPIEQPTAHKSSIGHTYILGISFAVGLALALALALLLERP